MSDIHGCKRVLLCAYLIFGAGVALWYSSPVNSYCTMANDVYSAMSGSMMSLVAGRIITGIGAAGLEVLISVIIKGQSAMLVIYDFFMGTDLARHGTTQGHRPYEELYQRCQDCWTGHRSSTWELDHKKSWMEMVSDAYL